MSRLALCLLLGLLLATSGCLAAGSCRTAVDCPGSHDTCVDGLCQHPPVCVTSSDCHASERCSDGYCVTATPCTSICSSENVCWGYPPICMPLYYECSERRVCEPRPSWTCGRDEDCGLDRTCEAGSCTAP